MNILITGGAGYIGTELVTLLESDPAVDKVVIYDSMVRNNYNLFLSKSTLGTDKLKLVKADILDSRKLFKEVEVADVVIHLAAKVTTPFADHNPHEFDQVNNWGTAELTYLVEKSKVSKFIYVSSVSVYGAQQNSVSLSSQPNPRTFYGISKLHGEEHVNRLRNSDTEVLVLRLGNVYGYSISMRFDSVINKFMFDANFTNRIRIMGDGSQTRSFIHIDRLSLLLKKACLKNVAPGTYNLIENTFSVNEVVDELKLLYPSLEMVYVNQNMKMRSLKIEPDTINSDFKPVSENKLRTDLTDFKDNFSF